MLEALGHIAHDMMLDMVPVHPALEDRQEGIGLLALDPGVGCENCGQGQPSRDPFDDHRLSGTD